MNRWLLTLVLGIALVTAGPATVGPSPAWAQACYSTQQARAAVLNGEIQPLSNLLPQVQAAANGQVVSSQLCVIAGHYVYLLSVLVGGQVHPVQVDAATGAVIP